MEEELPNEIHELNYVEIDGESYLEVNGLFTYNLKNWTEEEAIEDYCSDYRRYERCTLKNCI